MLHIPDRYGYFSPGPPSVQAKEGAFVPFMVIALSFANFVGAVIFILMKNQGKPNANMVPVISLAAAVADIAFVWVLGYTKRHGTEGDLKVRKE